jgi:hypothetical protein
MNYDSPNGSPIGISSSILKFNCEEVNEIVQSRYLSISSEGIEAGPS